MRHFGTQTEDPIQHIDHHTLMMPGTHPPETNSTEINTPETNIHPNIEHKDKTLQKSYQYFYYQISRVLVILKIQTKLLR